MQTVLIVIHLFVALAMVVVILLQRSEGGALSGLGGGSGPMGLVTAKGAGNILTRLTAIFGVIFMVTSLTLALMSRQTVVEVKSVLDQPVAQEQSSEAPVAPVEVPAAPVSAE
ncbi:MAG: preprotein translocase subunit SecG [Alphaproteobacteria bacterium]